MSRSAQFLRYMIASMEQLRMIKVGGLCPEGMLWGNVCLLCMIQHKLCSYESCLVLHHIRFCSKLSCRI
jgi:hypothetical protein